MSRVPVHEERSPVRGDIRPSEVPWGVSRSVSVP
jgi:hypothetical protein